MTDLSRRGFLSTSIGAACSAAASPLLTPVAFAAAPGENRLVVIVLRGAMDGLGVFAPYEDRDFKDLRPGATGASGADVIDLDGRFGMDARLAPLKPLWDRQELAIAHAVSTPYRGKRSHFDGQDLLESGVAHTGDVSSGWLNRALAHIDGAAPDIAVAVGREDMLLLRGDEPARAWAPGQKLSLGDDERALLDLIYAKDPLFADAMAEAEEMSALGGGARGARVEQIARYAADRLRAEARIAAFSIGGWDTHSNQQNALRAPLQRLSTTLTTLKDGLGPEWERTFVIAMTEFGRTARLNGARGSDHGTGGAAVIAGGALRGGRVYADWPGLGGGDLYEGRDLRPTTDVRNYPAWALAALFGAPIGALERDVFPGLDMGGRPSFLL